MKIFRVLFGLVALAVVGFFSYQENYKPQIYAFGSSADGASFEVDGKTFQLTIRQPVLLLEGIGAGKHTVTANGKELGSFEVGYLDGKSLLNLDLVPLVKVEQIYATDEKAYVEAEKKLQKNVITLNGKQYEGPYSLIEPQLYLKKDWDYSMAQPSPKEVKVKSFFGIGGDSATKTEVFEVSDFLHLHSRGEF